MSEQTHDAPTQLLMTLRILFRAMGILDYDDPREVYKISIVKRMLSSLYLYYSGQINLFEPLKNK